MKSVPGMQGPRARSSSRTFVAIAVRLLSGLAGVPTSAPLPPPNREITGVDMDTEAADEEIKDTAHKPTYERS